MTAVDYTALVESMLRVKPSEWPEMLVEDPSLVSALATVWRQRGEEHAALVRLAKAAREMCAADMNAHKLWADAVHAYSNADAHPLVRRALERET